MATDNPPPTPALALVVSALQRAVIDYPALNYVDRARDLLAKLAETNDAVYQRGYAEGCRHEAAEFKNFHRSLCERFGYTHDERDWKRDQCSLEEHIAKRLAPPDAIRAAEPCQTCEDVGVVVVNGHNRFCPDCNPEGRGPKVEPTLYMLVGKDGHREARVFYNCNAGCLADFDMMRPANAPHRFVPLYEHPPTPPSGAALCAKCGLSYGDHFAPDGGGCAGYEAPSPAQGWRPIDSVPEDTDVIVWHRGRVALGRRFTRDDGVIWTINGTSQHQAIWSGLKFDPPKLWQPMLEAPDVQ